jgi:hypothetical protein
VACAGHARARERRARGRRAVRGRQRRHDPGPSLSSVRTRPKPARAGLPRRVWRTRLDGRHVRIPSLVPHPRPRSMLTHFPVPPLLPLDCVLPPSHLCRGVLFCPHHISTRHVLSAPPGCLHVANARVNSFSVLNSSRFYSTSLLSAKSRFALAFSSANSSFPALACPWSQRTPPGCITDIDEHPLTRVRGPPAISYLVFPSQLLSRPLACARTLFIVLLCLIPPL